MGLPPTETHRAVYDMAVHDLGIERVGEFEDYLRRPKGYWTLERCQKIALKYSSRTEWTNSIDLASFQTAYRNGWLELCCAHMNIKFRAWTLEICQAAALNYSSKTQWSKSIDSASYRAAHKNGWLDLCCGHMIKPQILKQWTLEECKKIALQYSSKNKWRNSPDSTSYSTARHKNWLQECSSHMGTEQKPKGHWSLDRCKKIASKYSSRKEWQLNESASFNSARLKGWLDICCTHMLKKCKSWSLEECKTDAKKYSSRRDWKNSIDKKTLEYAYSKGWVEECCSHMNVLNNFWNLESCKEIALNYSRRSDWQKSQHRGGYLAAQRNGWLDKCCTHMKQRATSKV
jgi:hypothetical protein